MRSAWLDCYSGVSGNMALAAVIDAGAGPGRIRAAVKKVVPDFRLSVRQETRGHLGGVHVKVLFRKKGQPHRKLPHIVKMIQRSGLPKAVRDTSIQVFKNLADAEANVHRIKAENVRFHEVGAVDAIVDVVGCAVGMHELGIAEVVCSPLPMSMGEVECAHGKLPLPAPAVMELVKGAPVRGVPGDSELVTPTGAALAVTLASSFGPMPAMVVEAVGVGLGDRETPERPNILRLIVGRVLSSGDTVVQLETAIDDMSPERFDFLIDRLYQAGALEVMLAPVQMKKNRPGTLVRVLAAPDTRDGVVAELFNHSTTLGVRQYEVSRTVLPRESTVVNTPLGAVRVKLAKRPDGSRRVHVEYDDLKKVAEKSGESLSNMEESVMKTLSRPRARKR
jgi:uncharacterized protein (TIGR00299 family) protein